MILEKKYQGVHGIFFDKMGIDSHVPLVFYLFFLFHLHKTEFKSFYNTYMISAINVRMQREYFCICSGSVLKRLIFFKCKKHCVSNDPKRCSLSPKLFLLGFMQGLINNHKTVINIKLSNSCKDCLGQVPEI